MQDILIKNGLIVSADDTLQADLLIAGGSIDVVATNHCSFSYAEKLAQGKDDFSKAPGADGDVIIFDPHLKKTLTPNILRQNADYSPFEGRMVRGWPTTTIVRGRIVVQEGQLLVEEGWGQYMSRQQAGGSR